MNNFFLSGLHREASEGRQIPQSNLTQCKCAVKSIKSLLLRRAVKIAQFYSILIQQAKYHKTDTQRKSRVQQKANGVGYSAPFDNVSLGHTFVFTY